MFWVIKNPKINNRGEGGGGAGVGGGTIVLDSRVQ